MVLARRRPLGAGRIQTALAPVESQSAAHDRVTSMAFTVWLEVGTDIEHPHATADAATTIAELACDPFLPAISRLALAVVLIQHDGVSEASVLEVCRELLPPDHQWDTGASRVVTAHVTLLLGDTATASAACSYAEQLVGPLGDALLGAIARRLSPALGVELRRVLAVPATSAWPLALLGRHQLRAVRREAVFARHHPDPMASPCWARRVGSA